MMQAGRTVPKPTFTASATTDPSAELLGDSSDDVREAAARLGRQNMRPVELFMYGMLNLGLHDATQTACGSGAEALREDALGWMREEGEGVCGFGGICAYFGLDVVRVTRAVAHAIADGRQISLTLVALGVGKRRERDGQNGRRTRGAA